MKKFISLILSMLIICNLLFMTTAFAVDGEFWFTIDNFNFNIWSDGEVHLSILGYVGNDADVVIPEKISVDKVLSAEWDPWADEFVINDVKACGEYVPVSMIYSFGDDFFANPQSIKSITVPESVEINLDVDYDFVDGEFVGIPGNIFENCPGIEVIGASDEVYSIAEEKGYNWKKGESNTSLPETDEISVLVNGVKVEFDQKPIISQDRTLVPLRAIFEALKADVDWNAETSTVISERKNVKISLKIGTNELYVNDEVKLLDVPAQIIGDRTMVPARAVAEAFGCDVGWDALTKTVIITE